MANHFLAAHFPKRHFVGRHFPPPLSLVIVEPPTPNPEILPFGGSPAGTASFQTVRNRRIKRLIYEDELRDALVREAEEEGAPLGPILGSGGPVEIAIEDGGAPIEIVPGSRPGVDLSAPSFLRTRTEIATGHEVSIARAQVLTEELEQRNLRIAVRQAVRVIKDEEELLLVLVLSGEL